jgi:hypothetical protein
MYSNAMSAFRIPYELRIGVTGHRNLPDPAGVARAVARLFDHVQYVLTDAATFPRGTAGSQHGFFKRCDHLLTRVAKVVWPRLPVSPNHVPPEQRTPVQLVVISPLAKGADRIVARAAINQPQVDGRPRLQVVTPFSLDDYRRDFVEPDDRAEFEELLALDPSPTIMSNNYGLPQPGDSPEQLIAKQDQRNDGYFAVGKRVVDACEILIVIWNGQPAAGRGGTGDIVEYAVEQGRTILWIDSNHPEQAARQIIGHAPEKLGADEGVVLGFLHRPLPRRAKQLSYGFHRLAAYNRDPAFDEADYQAVINRNWKKLLESATQAGLAKEAIAPVVDLLLPQYARADQLAVRYQQLYVRAAEWLQRLSSIAVSVVVVQVMFFPEQLWLIVFEMLAMLLAVVLLRVSRSEAWHEKWLRDRHLAERLRIAMFTTLAGTTNESQTRPDEVLPFYQSTDDWIVESCERLAATARDKHLVPIAFEPLKEFLIAAWIGDQAKYHTNNAQRKGHASHWAHQLGLAFFCVTMLMALLHLLGVGHGAAGEHDAGHGFGLVGKLITALAIALPAWGATIHAVNTLLERERISIRSAQMAKVLKQVVHHAEQARTPEELSAVIRQAEEIMLMENHEWWVSLSFRPPVLPG